jgi:hypothetical protein
MQTATAATSTQSTVKHTPSLTQTTLRRADVATHMATRVHIVGHHVMNGRESRLLRIVHVLTPPAQALPPREDAAWHGGDIFAQSHLLVASRRPHHGSRSEANALVADVTRALQKGRFVALRQQTAPSAPSSQGSLAANSVPKPNRPTASARALSAAC